MPTFNILSIASVAVLFASSGFADLQPRQALPKQDRVVQPAYSAQLVVKFRDEIKARAGADGGVISLANADLDPIAAVRAAHDASFLQLIRLPRETLAFLENRAADFSGIAQPDLAGMMRVEAPADDLEATANALNALEIVEWVAFEQLAPPPPGGGGCGDIPPVTPLYHSRQTYHGPDPGLNMTAAWALGNTRGVGIRIADCEYGYVTGHEDLCGITMEEGQTIHPEVINRGWDEHGTAVFGVMLGTDNEFGCHGLAPEADAFFFTEWSLEEGLRRTTCIANAIATVDPGDVVVLEMQTTGAGGGFGPAELNQSVWTLVKNGTDAGVIVVAAAGNGNQNLDSEPYAEYRARGDSGAIIVGAGSSDTGHNKLSFSTYGSRVNVQGWGQNVFTLGYGSWAEHGGDKNQRYTHRFSGTSSATPFVASSCAALQSLADAELGRRLLPTEMRELLIETGISQGAGGHIGPFPDVLAAVVRIRETTGRRAVLTDFTVLDGELISGGLPELASSDDTYLETEAKVTGEAAETHRMLMRIRAMTAVQNPDTIDITLEAHITDIEAIVTLFLRDFQTGDFEQVGQFTNGLGVDTTNTVIVPNASRFVRPNGRIVLRVKKIVILPFTLNGFHSLEDLLEIRVR